MNDFDGRASEWDLDQQKVERARCIAEAISRSIPWRSGMQALDYGCGTGVLGLALRPRLAHVTLADSSRGMLEVVRQKLAAGALHDAAPLQLDLAVDPLPRQQFDLICTAMTLHHVLDTQALLRSFHALLRSPGFLCIADLDQEDGSFHGEAAHAHDGFDRGALALHLEQAGFRGVRFSTVTEIEKRAGAAVRRYPVFLAVCEKQAEGVPR